MDGVAGGSLIASEGIHQPRRFTLPPSLVFWGVEEAEVAIAKVHLLHDIESRFLLGRLQKTLLEEDG